MSSRISNFFLRYFNFFGILFENSARGYAAMKTRTWILIIGLILAASLVASSYFLMPREASTHAEITSYGNVIKTVDLRIDQEFTVENGSNGYNLIRVQGGKIAVVDASCPDHYCMKRGFCNNGTEIVCLPNRMTIRFLGLQEIDAVVG